MKNLVLILPLFLAAQLNAERFESPVSQRGQALKVKDAGCRPLYLDYGQTSVGVPQAVSVYWLLQSTGAYVAVLRDSDTANTSSAVHYQVENSTSLDIRLTEFKVPLKFKNGLSLNSSNTEGAVTACYVFTSTTTLYAMDAPTNWAGQDVDVEDSGCVLTTVNGFQNGGTTVVPTNVFTQDLAASSDDGTLIYSIDIGTSTNGNTNFVAIADSTTATTADVHILPQINGGGFQLGDTTVKPFGKRLDLDPPLRASGRIKVKPSATSNGPRISVCTRARHKD